MCVKSVPWLAPAKTQKVKGPFWKHLRFAMLLFGGRIQITLYESGGYNDIKR